MGPRTIPKWAIFVLIVLIQIINISCSSKPELQVSAHSHHFAGDPYTLTTETSWSFKVWNSGDDNSVLNFTVEPQKEWILVNPTQGRIKKGDPGIDISVQITRTDRFAYKAHPWFATGTIRVFSEDQEKIITITTVPNFFTEVFRGMFRREFDLTNTTIIFNPDRSLSYYKQTIKRNVTQFPHLPANTGNPAIFSIQDPYPINLSVQSFPYYGKEYKTIYISSKGYISFGEPGIEPSDLGKHFIYPQISLFPVDASKAGIGDGAYFIILADKLVISYVNTPLSSAYIDNNLPTDNSLNNIQVELYYSGEIRITYLTINNSFRYAIVGLSCGGGNGTKPPIDDFILSDLTSAQEI